MTPELARKIVVAAFLIGTVTIVYDGKTTGKPAAKTYKRVWGLLLLIAGGSVLADFAPGIVGPYLLLALLGFTIADKQGIGNLLGTAGTAAQGATGNTSTGNASTGG